MKTLARTIGSLLLICSTVSVSADEPIPHFQKFVEGTTISNPDANGLLPQVGATSYSPGGRTVSGDGRFVVFASESANLVPDDTNGTSDVFLRDVINKRTVRVSVSSDGAQATGDSYSPSISGDGRYIAFTSSAVGMDSKDNDDDADIYVHDVQTNTTKLISISSAGIKSNSVCDSPTVSGNGRFVAFISRATNLVAGTQDSFLSRAYRHDMVTGKTEAVSIYKTGIPGSAVDTSISFDGSKVAFSSGDQQLYVDEFGGSGDQVFLRDFNLNKTVLVSQTDHSIGLEDGCEAPSIDYLGQSIVFTCIPNSYTNPDGSDVFTNRQVFYINLETGVKKRISQSPSGIPGNAGSYEPTISGNGRHIAFSSHARNILNESSQTSSTAKDLYVFNLDHNTMSGAGPENVATDSGWPSLSESGEKLVFTSDYPGYAGSDSNSVYMDVFLLSGHDGSVQQVGVADKNGPYSGAGYGLPSAVSADGRFVVFSAGLGLTNTPAPPLSMLPVHAGFPYLYDRVQKKTVAVSVDQTGTLSMGGPTAISDNARYITLLSLSNGMLNVFLRDMVEKKTIKLSAGLGGYDANDFSIDADISGDGKFVVFSSRASNLVPDDTNTGHFDPYFNRVLFGSDVFIWNSQSNSLKRISTDVDGKQLEGDSMDASISHNGRFVVFSVAAPVEYLNSSGILNIARYDRINDNISFVKFPHNIGSSGTKLSVTDDGRLVTFSSRSTFLSDEDTSDDNDIYAYDFLTEGFELISKPSTNYTTYPGDSLNSSMSADGRYVAFSTVENLGVGFNPSPLAYVRDRLVGTTTAISMDRFDQEARADSRVVDISADGQWIYINSSSEGWRLDAGNQQRWSGTLLIRTPAASLSGAFYDPSNPGHGFLFEQINVNGSLYLVATWYTYLNGKQLWMVGTAPIIDNRASVPMSILAGGEFPPAFDPSSVVSQSFGTLELVMSDSNHGHARWISSINELDSGEADIVRLTTISNTYMPFELSACYSGSWYNPQQSGHGLQLQVLDNGDAQTAVAIWYHYLNGEPRWLLGSGPVEGDHADLSMIITHGPNFPPDYDPADQVQETWGSLTFQISGANEAHIEWDADYAGYGDGSLELKRLTQLDGHACLN